MSVEKMVNDLSIGHVEIWTNEDGDKVVRHNGGDPTVGDTLAEALLSVSDPPAPQDAVADGDNDMAEAERLRDAASDAMAARERLPVPAVPEWTNTGRIELTLDMIEATAGDVADEHQRLSIRSHVKSLRGFLAAQPEGGELRDALQALVDKLDAIEKHHSYKGDGPSWEHELKAARSLLSARCPEAGGFDWKEEADRYEYILRVVCKMYHHDTAGYFRIPPTTEGGEPCKTRSTPPTRSSSPCRSG